jgi:hypothetical protein
MTMVSLLMTPRARVLAKLAEQAKAQAQIAATLDRKTCGAGFEQHVADHAATAALFTRLHKLVDDGLLDSPEARYGA